MKKKNVIWFCPLIVIGLVLILTNTCKKEDNKISDVDGNIYSSVTIGTQVWMVENLKTTKYSNGDLIGTTTPATLDISAEAAPKYQWAYDGNESNVNTYARLYTWYAVTDSRNVCPTGWHVPADAEWTTLTSYLGGEIYAGDKLKETGTNHWITPNTGTNESGFTALPSGARSYTNGAFSGIGYAGYWWSSTEVSTTNAYLRGVYYNNTDASQINDGKKGGYSVRCLKDN
jgi:uncharacterized protein (TIGR02145 family)